MFFQEIESLKRHIENKSKVPVLLGARDPGPNQLPVVRIIHNQKGQITRYTEAGLTANLPVTIQIISDRASETSAWTVLDNILLNMHTFNAEKGHILEEEVSPGYEESIFFITLALNLKLRYLKT